MNKQALVHWLIAHIDALIAEQVAVIRSQSLWLTLESRWCGLHDLVSSQPCHRGEMIQVRMLDVNDVELYKDTLRADDLDQSWLFEKCYADEYDTPGGQPYGLLLLDSYMSFSGHIDWMLLLRFLGQVGAACFAPVLVGVAADFLSVDCFQDLDAGVDVSAIFTENQYARWRQLRQQEDMRFVSLVAAKSIISGDMTRPIEANGIYMIAKMAMMSFYQSAWFCSMRHHYLDQPGLCYGYDDHHQYMTSSLPITLSLSQENQLADQGIISLFEYPHSQKVTSRALVCVHQPKHYRDEKDSQSALLSVMLPYLLCASRFAHYIKIIMRDKLGQFTDSAQLQADVQNWLFGYCGQVTSGNDMQLAKHPLRDGRIDIAADAYNPGHLRCRISLQPNFHVDGLHAQLRFVTRAQGVADAV